MKDEPTNLIPWASGREWEVEPDQIDSSLPGQAKSTTSRFGARGPKYVQLRNFTSEPNAFFHGSYLPFFVGVKGRLTKKGENQAEDRKEGCSARQFGEAVAERVND